MQRLNPDKLSVSLYPNVTSLNPIIPRHYTLTHSDLTAELFLTIGRCYAYEKIDEKRDEVLAKWVFMNNQYKLFVYVYIGRPFQKDTAKKRYQIFTRELPLALEALRFGDRPFFDNHPQLDFSPILVHFTSDDPKFDHTEFWGMPEQYR